MLKFLASYFGMVLIKCSCTLTSAHVISFPCVSDCRSNQGQRVSDFLAYRMVPDSLELPMDLGNLWAGAWNATQTAALTCRMAVLPNNSEVQTHPFPTTRVHIPVCPTTRHVLLLRVVHTTAIVCLHIADLAVVPGHVLHPLADPGHDLVLLAHGVGHAQGHPLATIGAHCAREGGLWVFGFSEKLSSSPCMNTHTCTQSIQSGVYLSCVVPVCYVVDIFWYLALSLHSSLNHSL